MRFPPPPPVDTYVQPVLQVCSACGAKVKVTTYRVSFGAKSTITPPVCGACQHGDPVEVWAK